MQRHARCCSHPSTARTSLQGSKMAGKSVQSAGLRGMPGLFLVYIDKEDGTQMHAVAPDHVLQVGRLCPQRGCYRVLLRASTCYRVLPRALPPPATACSSHWLREQTTFVGDWHATALRAWVLLICALSRGGLCCFNQEGSCVWGHSYPPPFFLTQLAPLFSCSTAPLGLRGCPLSATSPLKVLPGFFSCYGAQKAGPIQIVCWAPWQ